MLFKKRKPDESKRARRPVMPGGSGVQPVFSYHARAMRSDADESRRRKTKLPWLNSSERQDSPRPAPPKSPKRIIAVCASVLLVFAVLFNLFLGRNPTVVTIADTSGRRALLRSHTAYAEAAQDILASSLLNFSKLTADTNRISESLKQKFPELEEVAVTLPLVGHQPVVHLMPAQPALILGSGGSLLVLDKEGRVVADASKGRDFGKLGLPVVRDDSGLSVDMGRIGLPGSHVSFITEVAGQLKAKKIEVTGLTLPSGTSQLEVRVKDKPYTVKFNLHGNAREEAGAFLAVKRHLERQNVTPSSYIDVRVDNRAYYR